VNDVSTDDRTRTYPEVEGALVPTPRTRTVAVRRPDRAWTHALLAIGLVVAFVAGWVVTEAQSLTRSPCLAAARTIQSGQVLRDGDLSVVWLVPDPSMAVISADRRPAMVGQRVRLPVLAGALISWSVLEQAWPPPGQAVVAVPVTPDRLPAGIGPGSQVLAVPARTTGDPGAAFGRAGPETGIVVAVNFSYDDRDSVSLLLSAAAAARLATAVSSEYTLVWLGGIGG
jgi:hypothetical protein